MRDVHGAVDTQPINAAFAALPGLKALSLWFKWSDTVGSNDRKQSFPSAATGCAELTALEIFGFPLAAFQTASATSAICSG